MWHDVGHTSNLSLSWDKRGIRAKIAHFSWFDRDRERGEPKASFHDLWNSVGRFSSGQEQKFITSTRGMRGYLERRISPKIQERRFLEIEVVRFRSLSTHVSTLQEVRDSSYLGLLSIFGPGKEGFSLRVYLAKKKKWGFQVLLDVSSPRRRCKSS